MKQLKPNLLLNSPPSEPTNFNSQEHQNVLRIELSYPPNEKKGTKLKLTIDWQSMRSRDLSGIERWSARLIVKTRYFREWRTMARNGT